jgi:hypothetical protein
MLGVARHVEESTATAKTGKITAKAGRVAPAAGRTLIGHAKAARRSARRRPVAMAGKSD